MTCSDDTLYKFVTFQHACTFACCRPADLFKKRLFRLKRILVFVQLVCRLKAKRSWVHVHWPVGDFLCGSQSWISKTLGG